MPTVRDIYNFIDSFAPFSAAEAWDNSGLLTGDFCEKAEGVIVCLDLTAQVLAEARASGANVIVTHHPIIFHPLKNIMSDSLISGIVRAGLNVICAHTNLDISSDGVNTHLARSLGLSNITELIPSGHEETRFGCVGSLEREMSPEQFAAHVKKALGCSGVRLADGGKPVKTVAVCGGSGSDFLSIAAKKADAYVTSEVKHSVFLDALHAGLTVVEPSHHASEAIVLAPLCARIREKFPDIPAVVSENTHEPARFV